MPDDIEPLDETVDPDTVSAQAQEILMLRHVIRVQGEVLDGLASEARKLQLSGNPGVAEAGKKLSLMIPS